AHPADILIRQVGEQRAGRIQVHQGLAVLPLGRLADMAAQHVHHQLAAVADAQDRHAPGVDFRVDGGGIGQVGAVGAAGEDDALGVPGLDLCQVGFVGINLAIDVAFPDTAGDELVILAAEIENDDGFLLHGTLLSLHTRYHTVIGLLYHDLSNIATYGPACYSAKPAKDGHRSGPNAGATSVLPGIQRDQHG